MKRRAKPSIGGFAGILSACLLLASGGVLAKGTAKTGTAGEAPSTRSVQVSSPGSGRLGPVGLILSSRMDISPPLRELRPGPTAKREKEEAVKNRRLPKYKGLKAGEAPEGFDAAVQTWQPTEAMSAPVQNWEAIGNLDGVLPPDPTGAVGPNNYVQWVNLHMAVYSKTGILLWGPYPGNTIWSGFGGPCDSCNNGDPVVLYDQLADRWVISQFTIPSTRTGPYYQYVAVSTSSDPLGTWYRYSFEWGNGNNKFNDYPKLGVWPDGYYMTANQFTSASGSWAGAGVAVLDRLSMLQGLPASIQYFDLYSVNPNYGGMLPGTVDGPAPPAGAPDYFAEVDDSSSIGPADALRIWSFHVDWGNPASTTFGSAGNPDWTLPVASFTPICASTRNCIPQPGTSVGLDAIGDRLMYRLQYRNFGDHQTLVLNHTVDAGSGVAGVRWYEVRNSGGGWSIYQQGTYAPDSDSRWMASAAMNRAGDIAVGFSVSSSATYPSIRYAGRLPTDPLGVLTQGEASLMSGSGSQTSTYYRWGDYTTLDVDPSDDCTFWYTNEYLTTTSSAGWHTRVGSFAMPCCTTPGVPTGLTASTPANNEVVLSWIGGSPAAATYNVYRYASSSVSCPGGGYARVASGLTSSAYTDSTVSGGTIYSYEVTAVDATGLCESAVSNCASATATGACTLPPTFSGLTSVTNPGDATCTLNLAWGAATPNCGSSVYYKIYRSASSPFDPSSSTLIATGVSSLAFTDAAALTNGTRYYYIVRAVDGSSGSEDGNVVTLSAVVSGPYSSGSFSDDVEGGKVSQVSQQDANWSIQTCSSHSASHSWHMGQADCTGIPIDAGTYTLAYSLNVGPYAQLGSAQFYHTFQGYSNATFTDAIYFEIDPANSGTWTTVASWQAKNGAWSTMALAGPYDLSAYAAGSSGVARLRFRFTSGANWTVTGGNKAAGWNVDDLQVSYNTAASCAAGSPAGTVKPVSDGRWVSGTPISATKTASDGSAATLTWDVSTCTDTNYNVYWGKGSQVGSYTLLGSHCGMGTSGIYPWSGVPAIPPEETYIWWVIVGTDGVAMESSWGKDSSGNERHPAASGQCGFTAKSTATTCP